MFLPEGPVVLVFVLLGGMCSLLCIRTSRQSYGTRAGVAESLIFNVGT